MTRIPQERPSLDEDDARAVQRVFESGLLATGDEVALFERELAAWLGLPDSVVVASGFAALHLALVALGIGPGDEVVVPCVSTCAAPRDAVAACGARAVFADTAADTPNLSAETVSSARTPRTRAVLCPHHLGIPAPLGPLLDLGLPVVEDCAQAIGASQACRPVGTLGAASTFSFYATKLLTSVDGGALASHDPRLLACARDRRYYGGHWDGVPRFNYKLANLHAALGRAQLRKLPALLARRRTLGERYRDALLADGVPPRALLLPPAGGVFFRFGLRVPGARRAALLDDLARRGAPARVELGFLCPETARFPSALRLARELLTLPVYPALRDEELATILDGLRGALRSNGLGADGDWE